MNMYPYTPHISRNEHLIRLVGIYWQFFLPIRARAHEGRPVILRSFAAALRHQGLLKVEEVGQNPVTPFNHQSGAGYLLVEKRYLVDVTEATEITPAIVSDARRKHGHSYTLCLFNFGSDFPDWYPQFQKPSELEQETSGFWLDDDDDDDESTDFDD